MKALRQHMKTLRTSFIISFLLILNSCSQVVIKNTEWCADSGRIGATCFNTMTPVTRDIPKKKWEEERFGMICTKAEDFAVIKTSLLQLCLMAGKRCKYDVRESEIINNSDDSKSSKTHYIDRAR